MDWWYVVYWYVEHTWSSAFVSPRTAGSGRKSAAVPSSSDWSAAHSCCREWSPQGRHLELNPQHSPYLTCRLQAGTNTPQRLIPSSSVSTRSSELSLRPSGLLRRSLRLTLVNGGRLRTMCCGTVLRVSYTTSSQTCSFTGSLQETNLSLPVSSATCYLLMSPHMAKLFICWPSTLPLSNLPTNCP